MPTKQTKQINLIPQDDFSKGTFGRILKWALSTFRFMVIITELIVMSAFLSRFWLDTKNSDLNESLEANKSQVLAYSKIESDFRNIQNKLSIAKDIYSQKKTSDLVSSIAELIPADVTLNTISIINNQVQIKAFSFSERSISQFLVNLEDFKELKNVNLSQISSSVDDENIIIFSISAEGINSNE